MTFTCELDPDNVKTKQQATYLGQRSCESKVSLIFPTQTYIEPIANCAGNDTYLLPVGFAFLYCISLYLFFILPPCHGE